MSQEKTTPRSVIRNFKRRANAPEIRKAIVEALASGVGEVHCIVERDGKQHFTCFMLDQLYELLSKSAIQMAGSMNKEIVRKGRKVTTTAKVGEA